MPTGGWIVELEPGVWIAPWPGDPGRTLLRGNAKQFRRESDARRSLAQARKYSPFVAAEVYEDIQ